MTQTKASTSMFISHIALVFTLIELSNAHYAEVEAPWIIPRREAHSFLTAPTRNKRSDPDCNTNEYYCEANKDSCMMHNEQSREHYCGQGHTCTATQACYLSTPCPAHYALGCTDDQCLSFPCHNGATCQDTSTSYNCQCVPGWDPATNCATDYNECQSVPCLNGGSCNNLFNDFTCDCTGRYEGSVCEKDCRPGPADIVFVVDTSDSLQKGVNKSIDFINQFISKVPIGRNDFQIGVIAYNFNSTVLFDLDDYTSASDMSSVLKTVRGEEAATYTATALRQAREMITSYSMGSRGTASYIVLMHDGLSTDRNEAFYEAQIINSMGIRILTVGIGQSIAYIEMLTISNSQFYTFSPNHLDDMYNQILKETVHTDCTDCNLEEDTQVIILLDTNGNQTIDSYNDRLTATRNTIDKILSYNPSANIGMYSYSDEPEEVFSLTWSGDKDKRIAAALQIDLDNHLSSNLSHALQHLRISNQFTSLRKMVVIVSNGMWTDMDEIKKEVSYSEVHGIEVNGVVAGEDNVIENFQTVLNDPSQVFYAEDGDFRALDSLTAMTKYYVCVDNIFSTRQ
ncbi:collagen alpha-6(VI) chain-like isoform X2 [Mytilus californianus]|uniref:collagen alpha-6(VI) chain-like isoform X2 n=1 Tax=Mytilus californianus TaxID=6549 RepID=UPI002247B8A2|nr:collagen alpha-6(VI) chain-like isoform X2 [Mytilus californianus]